MRYDDASQTGAFTSDAPTARDDADHLAAADFGPATGNAISGLGTITGATGIDMVGAGQGQITAITGAGGTDTTFSAGNLEVAGQYGVLTIDAQGNYSYVRNPGTPAGVSDVFTYTLADSAGATDTANLTINIGDVPMLQAQGNRVVPGPDGVVVLPPGVELSDIRVVGRDLVITLPDGTTMTIVDGAVFVPQLVLDGVEVPASNLAALLIGSEPQPAAGSETALQQSSGGNFAVPVSPLDPGVPLGDLIPPTELDYTPPEFDEPAQFIDDEITVIIVTPDNPAGAVNATDSVDEAGLPARPEDEPEGSGEEAAAGANGDPSEATNGTIVINAPDGLDSVEINGVLVTGVGQAIAGTFGTLVITSINGTNIGYSYTLLDNTSGNNTADLFTVVVADEDGDTATATLTVSIIDDVPNARNDADSVAEGGPIVADGNVFTGVGGSDANGTDGVRDTPGADDAELQGFSQGGTAGSLGVAFNAAHGTLVLNANGTYTYTLDVSDPAVRALGNGDTLTEVFTYTIVDGDGDTDTATLTITINGTNEAPRVGDAAATVSEEGLPDGNPDTVGVPSDDTNSATVSGNIAVADPDGDPVAVSLGVPSGTFTSGGDPITWVVSPDGHTLTGSAGGNPVITVTIQDDGDFTVTLQGPIDHPVDGVEDELAIEIPVTADDGSETASGTLTVTVEDDSPVVDTGDRSQPTLVVDETLLGTNDSASFAGAFGVAFGADGPAASSSITYALGINAGATGLVDTATGLAVVLSVEGGAVVGRAGAAGPIVFTVSVDASGNVTLDQQRAVVHNDPVDHDEPGASAATLGADNLVTLTATATDADGDSDSATINIGQNLQFEDDGPSISGTGDQPTLIVDETVLGTNDTASFASVFSASFGADGPAASNSITYSLGINAGATGLVDTATGLAVMLTVEGGSVVGRAGPAGPIVFTVSVDASGNVTLDQQRAVVHNDPADHDESGASAATLSADNLVTLTATVTDGDGDTDSATVNIGRNLQFEDDGPSISSDGPQATLVVDETVLATDDTASFAGAFSASFGADGPAAANSITYALGINAGATGLVDTATGLAVVLTVEGGQVVGRAGPAGPIVFTVSVDASGNVTLDQQRAVVHNDPADPDESGASAATLGADNLITLTATATDGDGDSDSATINIGQNLQFEDDGPTIDSTQVEATLVVDETVLATNDTESFAAAFSASFGADGPAASNSISYTLGINAGATGLVDTATGLAVVLSVESGQVVGRAGAAGPIVFTVSVDAGGNVTLDQQRAVVHNDPADHDESGASAATLSADNLITLTATATDGDGDTDSATINIGQNLQFEDDGPSVSGSGTQPNLVVDETVLGTNATQSFASVFSPAFGADGPAASNPVAYALGINAGATGLTDTATGLAVVLTVESGQVVGRAGPAGPIVFTVSVDAGGNVTLDQQRAVVHNDPADHDESGASAATLSADDLVTLTATVTDGDGDTATATANIGQNLRFEDDGPTITSDGPQATLVVDETVLATDDTGSFAGAFSASFGADGPAAVNSITYALGINAGATGLVDTATGLAVVLSLEAGQVVGRAGAAGPIVFTVSVDGAGNVTLDQQRAVVHNDPADPDEPGASAATLSADNLITLTATATDGDGDSDSATINIGQNLQFEDDGPSVSNTGPQVTLVVDETVLATNDTDSFAGAFSVNFGADGPAASNSITYVLGINAGATGLVDTATGLAVVLTVESGVVVGRAGPAGPIVFTVSVDAGGNVTLDQQRAVVHNDSADHDEPGASAATLSADNLVTLTATATDGDGDTYSATISIGKNLQFEDDGPSISPTQAEPTLVVDETVLGTNDTESFAGAFSANFGADGPAASNSITYALGINAGATGLTDTATGLAVVLTVEAGQVVGRAGAAGPIVFTVSVDGSGNVTLDQQRAVVHDDPADHDEPGASAATLSADNLITLTATATDGDGDTDSATINIGQNLQFEDDGPSVAASATQPTLVVDETVLGTNDTASFAGVFTPSFGADGPAASNSITYALGINAGATGLTDTATGLAVVLTVESGQVVGRAGPAGPIVFTVSVDGSGNVTLDQQRAVVHNDPADPDEPGASAATLAADNLITLTATVTDGDGDTASATANIGQNLQFEDDGPSISGTGPQPILVVDETVLATNDTDSFAGAFSANFGADGPAASNSITYALGINAGATGLVDTASGLAVVLTVESGVVVGRAGAAGPIVFTVSVDGSGNVTLDQQRAVVHNDPADPDEPGASAATLSADNLITLTATATDKDGDTDSATINIGQNLQFEDDGPDINPTQVEATLVVDETQLGTNDTESFAGAFSANFGADGPAASNSITYALGINAGATGLVDTATGLAVVLTVESGVVVGRAGAAGPIVFTVSVDGSGNVTLDQQRAVVHNDPADHDEPGSSAATLSADNLITLTATATDKDGDTDSATINIGQNLQFEDDGPSIVASGTQPTLVVDETTLGTNDTESFASVFTPTFGADGPATSNSVTYALGINAGATGLTDTATGLAVVLTVEAGQVVGRAGAAGPIVFTVSVDGSGNVTLDQQRAVVHDDPADHDEPGASAATLAADNLITLTATVTDGDGDTASATANIGQNLQFEDDGPSIVASGTQPILVVDETVLGTNDTDSFASVFTPTFGADGPATSNSVTYALGINAGATGITDTATGLAVVLTVEAGQVVGRAGAAGPIVFTVSVDGAGNVTLDQQRAVVHNDPADPDEPGASAVTLAADNLITLTATATDKDGDTATATANIGQNLQFEDDGPDINPTQVEATLVVDETQLGTNDTESFAAAFSATFGADGPAASNSITYALGINAGATGLFDTATGNQVVLTVESGQVVGRAGAAGPIVFTVSVDGSGNVTLDQQRAVVHNDPADHDEPGASAATLAADNLITLTATATDKDGDTDSATINIGQNLQFEDDGPSVAASATQPTLVVDETVLGTNDTQSFASVFTPTFGADGPATSNSVAYALGINAGVTGLVDTATGLAVVLTVESGVVVGRAGAAGPIVFTVSVDGSGNVTLDQQRAVVHNDPADPDEPGASAATLSADNLITLTATATDKDGDTASATANIGQNLQFEDDGPSVIASGTQPTLAVDETVLGTNDTASFASVFTPTFGADGAAAANSVTYALGINAGATGITDTATGLAVVLSVEAGQVVGRAGAAGPIVFTVSVDASGNVTLDQQRAVVHNDPADPDESGLSAVTLAADNLITLTATATDKDGDTASATANIGQNLQFEDDGPTLGTIQDGTANNDPLSPVTTGSLNFAPGADGAGTTMTITADVTGLTSGGVALETLQSGNVLTAYTDANNNNAVDAGEAVFTLTIDPTAGPSGGTYTFDLIKPLDPQVTDTPIGGSSSFGAGPTGFQILTSPLGVELSVVSGFNAGVGFNQATWQAGVPATGLTTAGVNGSTAGWGIGNNNFDDGEFFNWDFGNQPFDDPDGPGGFTPPEYGPDDPDPQVEAQLPDISFATFDFIGYTAADDIYFVVHFTDGTFTSGQIPDANLGSGPNWTFSAPAGKFIADIEMYTPNAAPGKVDLVSVGVTTTSLNTDIDFSLQLTDGDGDTTTVGDFTINVANGNTPSTATPVVLDTNGDGAVSFLAHDEGVTYDYDGDGDAEATAWVAAGDSILVRDANGNGTVDNASEFVFGGNGVTDLEALHAQYGAQLDASDADFTMFALWNDANSNGVVDGGEMVSLAEAGVASISLVSDGQGYATAGGDVQVAGSSTYTNADGSTGIVADAAFLNASRSNEEQARVAANSNNVVLAAALAAAGLAAGSAAAESAPGSDDAGDAFAAAAVSVEPDYEASAINGGDSRSALDNEVKEAVNDDDASAQASSGSPADGGNAGELTAAELAVSQPTALLEATEAPESQMNVPTPAMDVAMPSAEALIAARLAGEAKSGEALEKIVAEALQGGGNEPDIDALLSNLPGNGLGENGAPQALTSPGGDTVPIGDMGQGGVFTFDAAAIITSEALALHPDAVQPV